MNPEPFTDDVKEAERKFNDPSYNEGWDAALSYITDTSHLTDKIDELQQDLNRKNFIIELNNNKIEELENELEIPWYTKLLRKLPRIKVSIER